jgi:hypothetical protein
MTDIQRYAPFAGGSMIDDDNGPLVRYADHVAAVAEAEERGRVIQAGVESAISQNAAYLRGYTRGARAAIAKAVNAIEEMAIARAGTVTVLASSGYVIDLQSVLARIKEVASHE